MHPQELYSLSNPTMGVKAKWFAGGEILVLRFLLPGAPGIAALSTADKDRILSGAQVLAEDFDDFTLIGCALDEPGAGPFPVYGSEPRVIAGGLTIDYVIRLRGAQLCYLSPDAWGAALTKYLGRLGPSAIEAVSVARADLTLVESSSWAPIVDFWRTMPDLYWQHEGTWAITRNGDAFRVAGIQDWGLSYTIGQADDPLRMKPLPYGRVPADGKAPGGQAVDVPTAPDPIAERKKKVVAATQQNWAIFGIAAVLGAIAVLRWR